MNTYLFTWNPEKWEWDTQNKMIAELPHKKPIHQWKTNRKNEIGNGDNFLLVKLGKYPNEEKGIIGIGKIVSNVYKDTDVIKNLESVNFVDLQFSQLSKTPLISLTELEKIDSNMHWTPEGNGNKVTASTFEKIFKRLNKDTDSLVFEKRIFFPIVAEQIDLALTYKPSINRDEIVQLLLEKYQTAIEKIARNSQQSSLFIAQNMVDWFSAELTKNSNFVAEWQDKYLRNKVTYNDREITNYSLAFNNSQDETIDETGFTYTEGSIKQITVNAYERNPQARKKCLEYWKYSCQCCGFNFEKTYGDIGKDFIHVHHKTPLSEIREEYLLDPINDLVPVCANCHAMIHRKTPAYKIEEIQDLLKKHKSDFLDLTKL